MESWKKLNPTYLSKMANAIVRNDKVFEVSGTIFDRKTGEALKNEEAIKLIPPASAALLTASLLSKNPDFIARQIVAKVNKNQVFTYGIELYDTNGNLLNPEEIINQEMSKKGISDDKIPSTFKSDQLFLVSLASSLKNNQPHFNYRNQIYDTETGLNLSSPFRSQNLLTEDFKLNKNKRINYQHFSDKETIINYHRDNFNNKECQNYAIIDKKNANITVYDLMGNKVFNKEVLVGIKVSDSKTRWTEYDDRSHQGSYTTGAGAFTIGQPKTGDYYSKNYSNNILQVEDQKVFSIHQVPNSLSKRYHAFDTGNPLDRRVSQGCVNMKAKDLVELTKWIKPSCKLYVLPEEANNKFVVKDNKIELVSTTPVEKSNNYNYSIEKSVYKPIVINSNWTA